VGKEIEMVEGSYSWVDVNGQPASNRLWATNSAGVASLAAKLKKLSNAKLKNAAVTTPVDISGISGNTAAAANVESARFKMIITASAPPVSAGGRRQIVTIEIPAPVGSYVNGLSGDTQNADIQALLDDLYTQAGTACDSIDKVAYAK
jgi:hypothetical protein